LSFFALNRLDQQHDEYFEQIRYKNTANTILRDITYYGVVTYDLRNHLDGINFVLIVDKKTAFKIINDKNIKTIFINKNPTYEIRKLKLAKDYYLLLNIDDMSILLKDSITIKSNDGKKMLMFVIIVSALLFAYLATIQKLSPIRKLIKEINKLGKGDFDIDCATDKEDEISLLSNEFDKSAKKLKNLKETRNIFIRNIMHELKTPIMKGKFIIELSDTPKNRQKMKDVFARLELLISEFAGIEELMSDANTDKPIQTSQYNLKDLTENAIVILMCDENLIEDRTTQKIYDVNFKLFSIVIKNLIDNAIKYSLDNRVMISNDEDELSFYSKGDKLKYDLKEYFKPFFNSNDNSNNSFGLGLYIVNYILKAHNMELEYRHDNGCNIFSIVK
jgi:two-component system OmpR family sensor kinase